MVSNFVRSGVTNFHRRNGLGLGSGIDDDKIRRVAHRKPIVGVRLWANGSKCGSSPGYQFSAMIARGGGAMLRRNVLTKATSAPGQGTKSLRDSPLRGMQEPIGRRPSAQ